MRPKRKRTTVEWNGIGDLLEERATRPYARHYGVGNGIEPDAVFPLAGRKMDRKKRERERERARPHLQLSSTTDGGSSHC